MSSCQVYAISRRGMDHFRFFKFILGSEAWGNKTKKMYYSLLSLKMISLVLFPSALQPSMNFIISELVYCPARKFFWFQFLFVPDESSQRKSLALTDSPVHPIPPPPPHLEGLILVLSKWRTGQSWHYCYLLIQQIIFLEKMINFVDSVWSLKLLSTQHILLYLLKCLEIHNKTQVRMNSALLTNYWHWFTIQFDKPSIKFENNKH